MLADANYSDDFKFNSTTKWKLNIKLFLNDNLKIFAPISGSFRQVQPITPEEIASLEVTYNNGNPFPASLKELLYLAGKFCYVLDYGANDSQAELQDDVREWLTDRGLSISRPFFVIDVYGGGPVFLFVYLDEGQDPDVFQADTDTDSNSIVPYIDKLNFSLSSYINLGIDKIKRGRNPF